MSNDIGNIQKSFYIKIEVPIEYTPWSEWSECNVPCGSNGIQYRRRTCILQDEAPSYNCSGETIQRRACNEFPCPVNGGWNSWSDWSECPECYDALDSQKPIQRRVRYCNSPPPSYSGLSCRGSDVEEEECEINACNIDGGWSEWTDFSACSTTCERGIQVRYRYCNYPTPTHNGRGCEGHHYETRYCLNAACEIPTTSSAPPKLETIEPRNKELRIDLIVSNNFDDIVNEAVQYEEQKAVRREISCRQGLRFNSSRRRCEDINECKMRPCKTNERCINIYGSYQCQKT